jgi:hypothetical protein
MGILMDIMVYISGDKIGMFYALGSMATSGWIPRDGYPSFVDDLATILAEFHQDWGISIYIYTYTECPFIGWSLSTCKDMNRVYDQQSLNIIMFRYRTNSSNRDTMGR